MRAKLIALIVTACAAGCQGRSASSGQTADKSRNEPATDAHHYYDDADQPLPRWDAVWTKLHGYFGSATPPHITLRRFSGSGGRFDGPSHAIVISSDLDENDLTQVIAHESSHLSLYDVTQGASAMEQFRFFDEGYSDIVGKTIGGDDMADHRQASLAIARTQLNANNLSFEKVQRWSTYAGNRPEEGNDYAYPVGSSFVYFISDSFGEKKLLDFFRDIGNTKDLDRSLRAVLGLATAEVEQRWKDYVVKASAPATPPELAEMVPANNASDVPVDLGELHVTFSVPMMKKICVSTPCGDSGVCYRNASWKDDRTLVIKTDGKLQPATTYDLELGSEQHGCLLMSTHGATLPSTHWKFTTKKAAPTPHAT